MGHLKFALAHIKLAATRQVKVLRKLVEEGKIEEAQRMASELERAGVLKKSQLGTNLKALGAGREGVADLVVGARDAPVGHEISVRKAYDPKASMFNPVLPDRKVQIGQELRHDPNFAQMFTQDRAHMVGNVPYHIAEYVPGQRFKDARLPPDEALKDMLAIEARGDVAATRVLGQPSSMHDLIHEKTSPTGERKLVVHSDNTRVTPSGQKKVIDYMPFTGEELRASGPGNLYTPDDLKKMHPNLPENHRELGSNPQTASQLDASRQNVVREGYQELGGSRQVRKVRGAKPPATAPITRPTAPAPVAAPPAHAPNLQPRAAPNLLNKFHALPTAGKAAVVGGLGLAGYGAYKMLRPKNAAPAGPQGPQSPGVPVPNLPRPPG